MKTRMHKILALVLALVLCLGVLSACDVNPAETTAPQAGNETTAPAGNETTAPTEPTVYEFPEGATMDLWNPYADKLPNNPVTGYIEDATGLKIEWKVKPEGGLNVLMTEKVTPSVYMSTGDVLFNEFGPDGVLVNLMEKKDIMPNFFKAFYAEGNENFVEKFQYSDTELYAAPIFQNGDHQMYGWIYRSDIMEELKLEVPTDWDSFVAVLKAMKTAYPSSYPFVLRQLTGTMASLVPFCQQFGFMWHKTQPTIDPATDTFRDPYITDAARDFLKKMNFLIDEGLMDKACLTYSTAEWTAAFTTGASFITHDKAFQLESLLGPGQAANPKFDLAWFNNIPMSDSDHPYSIVNKDASAYCYVITTKCPDIDLACRYIDWLYSEEGAQVTCWGVEGESYTVDADGNKHYIETADISMLSKYQLSGNMDFTATLSAYSEKTQNMILDTMAASAASTLKGNPTLDWNDDEKLVIDTYQASWYGCRGEHFQKFILGTLDIEDDAAWAAYVSKMKDGYHSDEIVAAYNAAYTRYKGQ